MRPEDKKEGTIKLRNKNARLNLEGRLKRVKDDQPSPGCRSATARERGEDAAAPR